MTSVCRNNINPQSILLQSIVGKLSNTEVMAVSKELRCINLLICFLKFCNGVFNKQLCAMCAARYLEYMQGAPPPEKKRKETLLSSDLGKFLDKKIRVKFQGGREGRTIYSDDHAYVYYMM